MKFINIYEESIQLWIENIDISDGKYTEETGEFYSENLTNIWNKADDAASSDWQSLMVWIIYQVVHKKAIEYFTNGILYFKIDSIDKLIVQDKYLKALQGEGYEDLLSDFENV